MTDSGVLMAWARLPTWVRARSTISRLASISALVSRASGAISTGNSPSSRSARPERISAIDSEMRFSGARPKRTWKIVVSTSTIDKREKGAAEVVIEAAGFVEDLAGVAGHADQELAVGAEIDRPLHHPQALPFGAIDIAEANAGRGRVRAVLLQLRQLLVPQRARGARFRLFGIGAGDLPVPAGQRQFEQRLAERLELVGRVVGGRHFGDQGAQIEIETAVESAFGGVAIDRRQYDAGKSRITTTQAVADRNSRVASELARIRT